MLDLANLQPLISTPREDLGVEYKTWLNLKTKEEQATLAKAAIAIANHGGGFVVIGFEEFDEHLVSIQRPQNIPVLTQDSVNAAVRRYASPEFHCAVHMILNATNNVEHPIIRVPSNLTEPVMSKRDCGGVIVRNRCYIRKPGPRSEEPQSGEEWRALINRCVRANREDMIDSIRSIVSGRVETIEAPPNVHAELSQFSEAARGRWQELSSVLPEDSTSRFPNGFYEMSFAIIGNETAQNLRNIQDRLREARSIRLTGWIPFLEMHGKESKPYPYDGMVEAWVGRPDKLRTLTDGPAHSDFWRVDKSGKLYTIRGYLEDELGQPPPGKVIEVTMPVWRVGEATYFALRYAEQFKDAKALAICARFTGLNGRTLTSVAKQRFMTDDRISRTNEIQLETTASLEQIKDNTVEVMHDLLTPFYELFSFFPLSQAFVEEELVRMKQGKL